jgi:hypothetical protein
MFHRFVLPVTVGIIFFSARSAFPCGFSESAEKVPTLREDATTSRILLFAEVVNSLGDHKKGSTDLIILKTLKSDAALAGKKVVRIPRYIPVPDGKNPPRLLLFGEMAKGEPDFFKGVPANEALIKYVEGAMQLEPKDRVKVMRFAFDYLDHPNTAISKDAFAEFLQSADPDIQKVGRSLNAPRIRLWLQDEKTPPGRLRLYAFLLAQCGEQQDTAMLRKLLDKLVAEDSPPLVDGIFAAYTILNHKEGWDYLCRMLKDSKKKFVVRYAAMRAVRYFFTLQSEFISEKDLLNAFRSALNQTDMADIPVDCLRQRKCWELTNEVLALSHKKDFESPLIQRSILRYALHCPEPTAIRFVTEMRKVDPKFVESMEKE